MSATTTETGAFSPYLSFDRDEWAQLRAATPLTLSESDLDTLRGLNEALSLDEVAQVYLPVVRLLNLYVRASQALYRVTDTFLGNPAAKVPFIIGIGGSVAAGKSTTARILQALLSRWSDHPKVDLLTTDGFLYPNAVLEARGIMQRKGFPESYDVRRLVRFVADLKSGRQGVAAPVYSHLTYDIVPGAEQVIGDPDIVLIEGLNVLQTGAAPGGSVPKVFVSDFFDFSIYVDADEQNLERWYVERFLRLRDTAFRDPASYFHRFAVLATDEAITVARQIWAEINAANLHENIEPTRERARLILQKGNEHLVERVYLRKL